MQNDEQTQKNLRPVFSGRSVIVPDEELEQETVSIRRVSKSPVLAVVEERMLPQADVGADTIADGRPPSLKPAPLMQVDLVKLNKWIVTAYKGAGFAALTAILLGLVSYLGLNLFYLGSSSWLEPVVVSPTDDRVLQLNAQLVEQQAARDKLASDRATIAAQRDDAARTAAMDRSFENAYEKAVRADLATRQAELRRMGRLTSAYTAAKAQIQRSNDAFAGMSREHLGELYRAHLIDRETYLQENYQLSQIAHANLSLSQQAAALSTQRDELARDANGLEALSRDDGGKLSYDALKIKHEYGRAVLEEAKMRDLGKALSASVASMDQSIARLDHTISSIKASPYVRAADEKVTIAFVPYENRGTVKPGAPLYACAIGPLFCHRVGSVGDVLPGETAVRHPLHNTTPRGLMVQVQLADSRAVEHKVLFAGGRPLLFL